MKHFLSFLSIAITFSAFFLYNGCKDGGTDPVDPPSGQTVTTTISGTVFDQSNNPLAGVEVKSAGQTLLTNNDGGFTFSGISVPKDRFVVNATKSGYFRGSNADVPKANGTSNIKIYLIEAGITQTVSATTGGEVVIANGSGVALTPNSVTKSDGSDYSGNVNVSMAYLDPTSDDFSNLIPGGDLQAQRNDNSMVTLYSYGIIKVEMKSDAGEDLQIKNGSTSTITVEIPESMEGTAPATIPLWHYDDVTGLWKEEGSATKQGDKYVGTVSHFSDWNCDVPEGTATVKGLVVDCNNLPVPGISVKIGQASANTGSDGKFERRVPANTAFEVQVTGNRNFGLTSLPVSVPPLSEGTIHDVGTLSVDCPVYVTGLIRCDNEIKIAQVVISWDGGYNSQFTNSEGRFTLAADVGKNAQLSIYTLDNKYRSLEIVTPVVRGEILDLGAVQVCEQTQVGDNNFTVNGGGFSNRTFVFSSDTTLVFGYYVPEDSVSYVFMFQTFGADTILLWTSFKGDKLGTAEEVSLFFVHNSNYYYALDQLPGTSAMVNITKYDGIGGLIEGTFSGTLTQMFGGPETVTITGGNFSVIRLLSGSQNKNLINKIPAELRSKLKLKTQ